MIQKLVLAILFAPNFVISQEQLTIDEEISEYMELKKDDDSESVAVGAVSNGSLIHGKLMPYNGENYNYFDRDSYLAGRGFMHHLVRYAVLATYDSLQKAIPGRYFGIMECANETGGELFPHKTHQNGLSIDFMMPLLKDGKPYYGLDTIGAAHYALNFDNNGKYIKDTSISVDFNLVAQHILLLDFFARKHGLNIGKVIIKIEFKDELFESHYGRLLKASDIYVVQGLNPIINSLHDDHFHIDFQFVN